MAPKLIYKSDARRLLAEDVPPLADKPGPVPGDVCNASNRREGGTATYTLRRLKRDNPELAEKVINARVLHLRCYTQQEIADAVGVAQPSVTAKIAEFIGNGKFSDSDIFGDFEREESTRFLDDLSQNGKHSDSIIFGDFEREESTRQISQSTPSPAA